MTHTRRRRAGRQGGDRASRRLLAYGLSDYYVEIFNITRLSDFVGVYPDEESALREASVS